MKQNSTISIAIATYNEADNIRRCLESVHDWVDEIIIVDGYSSDDTIKIASSFSKTKIIKTTNKPIFHINKQIAIDTASSDWIFQLDADEVVSPALKNEIRKILLSLPEDIKYAGFWIKRKNYFLGRFLTKGGVYPDPTIRLYKKGLGRLPCQDVHEQAEIKGAVGQLKHDLLHYADPNFSRYLLRSNRYTTLLAQDLLNQKLKLNLLSFLNYYLIKPVFWFISQYFRHRAYVDGFPGFVFAYFSALRFPMAYTKYWELRRTNRSINLSTDWDK